MKGPLSFPILAILIAAATTARSQTEPPTTCQGIDLKMSEEKVLTMEDCLKEAEVEGFPDITPEKMPCFFTCVMKKQQIVDESGVLRKENIERLVLEELPEEIRQDLNTRIGACFDEHGAKVSADNPTCTSIELADCVRMAYETVCTE